MPCAPEHLIKCTVCDKVGVMLNEDKFVGGRQVWGNWGIGESEVGMSENPEKIISMATSVDGVLQSGV